jgi:hypothetical protein
MGILEWLRAVALAKPVDYKGGPSESPAVGMARS